MKQLRTFRLLTALCAFAFLCTADAFAAKVNTTPEGIALNGYDVVAYFTENKPAMGSEKYSIQWNGATWFFKNQDNKRMFEKNPSEYAPQYGGFCAYAISRGSTADADPNAWEIVNGKLYLNINKKIQAFWARNKTQYIQRADANWRVLSR